MKEISNPIIWDAPSLHSQIIELKRMIKFTFEKKEKILSKIKTKKENIKKSDLIENLDQYQRKVDVVIQIFDIIEEHIKNTYKEKFQTSNMNEIQILEQEVNT